ncbi:DUF488 domain-containing protein [Mesorhizobium sp. BAC0120]|nr:DUF488 domain-containing protein [Mesorhizobium sp. BAC0120]MDW6025999.1 DUF488 domain-containing protein [Mesorhizobium sp. BAC0120]
MPYSFYTVGHSNRSLSGLVEILQAAGIEVVVDVRRMPGSGAHPQFNGDVLCRSLAEFQIGYEYIAALGGRRGRAMEIPPELNAGWHNRSFHNYADYALSLEFRGGFERLIGLGRERPCVIMCSEAVWWRCHRRIIADYLLARGEQVIHLMDKNRTEPAVLTKGAVVRDDHSVIYPAMGDLAG